MNEWNIYYNTEPNPMATCTRICEKIKCLQEDTDNYSLGKTEIKLQKLLPLFHMLMIIKSI